MKKEDEGLNLDQLCDKYFTEDDWKKVNDTSFACTEDLAYTLLDKGIITEDEVDRLIDED